MFRLAELVVKESEDSVVMVGIILEVVKSRTSPSIVVSSYLN
jgi:hypothetical protein